jgi:hypothetical protein
MAIGEIPGTRGEGAGDELRDDVCMLFAKKNFPVLLDSCLKGGGALGVGFVLRASIA